MATDAAGNSATTSRTVKVANISNQAPVAANDAFTAPYRSRSASYPAQVFNVLANDSDADGTLNVGSVKITKSPNKGGSVTVNANGTVSYTPARSYSGTESFSYTVKDNGGATSNTASVTVTVAPATAVAKTGNETRAPRRSAPDDGSERDGGSERG